MTYICCIAIQCIQWLRDEERGTYPICAQPVGVQLTIEHLLIGCNQTEVAITENNYCELH